MSSFIIIRRIEGLLTLVDLQGIHSDDHVSGSRGTCLRSVGLHIHCDLDLLLLSFDFRTFILDLLDH